MHISQMTVDSIREKYKIESTAKKPVRQEEVRLSYNDCNLGSALKEKSPGLPQSRASSKFKFLNKDIFTSEQELQDLTQNFGGKEEMGKSLLNKRQTPVTGRQASQKRLSPTSSCKNFDLEKSDYKMFS